MSRRIPLPALHPADLVAKASRYTQDVAVLGAALGGAALVYWVVSSLSGGRAVSTPVAPDAPSLDAHALDALDALDTEEALQHK